MDLSLHLKYKNFMEKGKRVLNPFEDMEDFNCFACGQHHDFGLHLKFFQVGEEVVTQLTARPDLCGLPQILHGGIQATVLDEILWWSVFQFTQRLCLTQDLQLDFKRAVKPGMNLVAKGRMVRKEKNTVWAQGEISMENRILIQANGRYFLPNDKLLARTFGLKPEQLPEKLKPYLQRAKEN
jgi:uncharacterized protein (TIGR00369 family)